MKIVMNAIHICKICFFFFLGEEKVLLNPNYNDNMLGSYI